MELCLLEERISSDRYIPYNTGTTTFTCTVYLHYEEAVFSTQLIII